MDISLALTQQFIKPTMVRSTLFCQMLSIITPVCKGSCITAVHGYNASSHNRPQFVPSAAIISMQDNWRTGSTFNIRYLLNKKEFRLLRQKNNFRYKNISLNYKNLQDISFFQYRYFTIRKNVARGVKCFYIPLERVASHP